MDEIIKQAIVQFPIAAIFIAALWIVYTDAKKDRAKCDEDNQKILEVVLKNAIILKDIADKV